MIVHAYTLDHSEVTSLELNGKRSELLKIKHLVDLLLIKFRYNFFYSSDFSQNKLKSQQNFQVSILHINDLDYGFIKIQKKKTI